MVDTILLPLDGSDLAEAAIPYCDLIARATGARIVLMRAVLTADPTRPWAPTFNAGLVEDAESYLAEIIALALSASVRTEGVVLDAEAGDAILQVIDAKGADLVVMSTHGRSARQGVLWGSVADRVLREAAIPVLLVPRDSEVHWDAETVFKLVVPLDGSALAEFVLPPAEELARVLSAQIVLVRAVGHEPGFPNGVFEGGGAALEYLERVATRLRQGGFNVEIAVRDGPAAAVVGQVTLETGAQSVVMASHARQPTDRLFLESVASMVIETVRVPILVVPSAAPDRKSGNEQPALAWWSFR